ncbi:hypothetical protein ACFLWB_01800 [Chloroflexota bacterium]
MAENYIKPEDVSPQNARKVLSFLNAAKSAKEVADAIGIPGERDVDITVAQLILDWRKELGRFATLQQIMDVSHINLKRFTQIVIALSGEQPEDSDKTQIVAIKKYKYLLMSSVGDGEPRLYLYDASDKIVAHVYFKNGSGPLPKATQNPGGLYTLHYRRSALLELIDMLRNEKPIYLQWWPPDTCWIGTSREPIGKNDTTSHISPA